MESRYILRFLQRVFFKPIVDDLSKLRQRWVFHPLKWKIRKKEKEILRMLQNHSVPFEIV